MASGLILTVVVKNHTLTIYEPSLADDAEFKAKISGPTFNQEFTFRAKDHPHYKDTMKIPMLKMRLDQTIIGEIEHSGKTKRILMYVFSHKANSWRVGIHLPGEPFNDLGDYTMKEQKVPTKGVHA